MTKHIRIENADMADYKVVVITEDLQNGVWVEVERQTLAYPTQMINPFLTSTRRFRIEEAPV